MKILLWISAALLFLAVFSFPIGYYTLLRLIVSLTAVLLCFKVIKDDNTLVMVISGIIALLFNPVFPIYLGEKSIWMPIDIITACFFIYVAITYKSSKSIESV
ncbi:DUF6804 family protein [Christiangramia sediminis]|uniref:Uncharacterized protein n=1 Tax=Christiangramia sediminis TaxID=2881336 RepID=A0A9X1LJR0_9FLAO|nr:DUF6804 family protein [Christiangramia sediminis]MCB7481618.1 hypothetical protein [Christiangramia sediminis]